MLTQLRRPVRLSFRSTDALLEFEIETVGTLYQKDRDRYHLVLTEPLVQEQEIISQVQAAAVSTSVSVPTPRLLWLEFSPFRVALTMQGNGLFSYRHLFEPSVYGTSRYWLQGASEYRTSQFRLRNFTRNLHVKGSPLPCCLLLEYELWSDQISLGHYLLNLEIQH